MTALPCLRWNEFLRNRDRLYADCEAGRYTVERKQAAGNRPGKAWIVKLNGAYVDVALSEADAKRKAVAHRATSRMQRKPA